MPSSAPPPRFKRFCLRCQADLLHPPQDSPGPCWKCGEPFDLEDPHTWATERVYVWWKFWLPCFLLATGSGILSYAICLQLGDLGLALFVAVPLSIGTVVGYGVPGHTWVVGCLGFLVLGSVVGGLLVLDLSGLFCGFILFGVFLIPVIAGVSLGLVLRSILTEIVPWNQRWFFDKLCLTGILLSPYATQAIENAFPRREQIETVQTSLTFHATPEEAWNAVMFYEEVTHERPWLLKLALPQPLRSVGDKSRVGEIVTCYYDKGVLKKRISRRVAQQRLEFDVVEQHLHFERDVTLLDGAFEVAPVDGQSTQVTLTTRYRRQLYPTWLWKPIERRVVHTLHEHVLEGMRRRAARTPDDRLDSIDTHPYSPVPDAEPAPL
ncbi:MFS transporter [Lignipirellula cremea]|uniref:Polyketide cyclase / dehydrase and lipid transport n=1 Tax=Lignipirellula cremea TaxID=2528010 RepID=A0A518DNC2_9BACT|nr:hypothetical protein [Lignipirellula cremea]QDU93338.1 Polyketide cyclase / dehydrase and lipid transport [Lignipirellula cremea]